MKKNTVKKAPRLNHHQDGAALLVSMMVLLGLTLLGLNMSQNSRLETVMARNSQLQLEAWNQSYSQISQLLNTINARSVAQGIPDYIASLVMGGDSVCVSSGQNCEYAGDLDATGAVKKDFRILLEDISCLDATGGSSVGLIGLNELRLESGTQIYSEDGVNTTGIGSAQRQRFQIKFTYSQRGSCTPETEIRDTAEIP